MMMMSIDIVLDSGHFKRVGGGGGACLVQCSIDGNNCSLMYFLTSIGLGLGLQWGYIVGLGLGLGLGLGIMFDPGLTLGIWLTKKWSQEGVYYNCVV